MDKSRFILYLIICAGVTYLIRMLPLVLIKKKITNRFLLSFLHYIPYAVLTVMTLPGIFYATSSPWSAAAGLVAALIMAWRDHSMITVAATACGAALLVELLLPLL